MTPRILHHTPKEYIILTDDMKTQAGDFYAFGNKYFEITEKSPFFNKFPREIPGNIIIRLKYH
jgi:hypothetical protein